MNYSVVIRTLGKAGQKYQTLLNSLKTQTIKPEAIYVYIAEGYIIPKETIGEEIYVYVNKGMVAQRALKYEEVTSEYILFLDDDVYLPPDGVEKLFGAMFMMDANVVSPDVFHNANRSMTGKIMMAISGRMRPRKDDKKWAYKVMRNSGYSYNSSPSEDVYMSETNAGPCFLCSKSDFLNIHFEDEMWLDSCTYALGDDQVMFYKMTCLGYKQLTVFNTGIVHLDAGTTLLSEDKEKKLMFSDLRFKIISWHRFIFLPERNKCLKLLNYLCIIYTLVFTLMISLLKGRMDILKVKCSSIRESLKFLRSDDYRMLPKIYKS